MTASPLRVALESIHDATQSLGSDRFVATGALRNVASGLAELAGGDGRDASALHEPAIAEALARLHVGQQTCIQEIRLLAARISGAGLEELVEIALLSRGAATSVYRKEIRKQRLRTRAAGDLLGGDGG